MGLDERRHRTAETMTCLVSSETFVEIGPSTVLSDAK